MSFKVSNEFATVRLRIIDTARGGLLEVASDLTGRTIRLDALELEALAGVTHRDLDEFVLRTAQAPADLRQIETERAARGLV